MIFRQRISIKKLLVILIILCANNLQGKPCYLTLQHKETKKQSVITRKFNTAAFFQGLANTCAHAGTVATAQTQQEKQQAACNVLASVFQTAAVLSEKSKKRSLPSTDMVTTTIKSTITFLNTFSQEKKDHLLTPNYAYLRAITTLHTEQDQAHFIAQTLAHKEDGSAFIGELFSLFKNIVSDQLPEFFDTLALDVIKNLNLN
jgi:hypothetical protein